MYVPLTASEDGIFQLIKQPGVGLEPGGILGILTRQSCARQARENIRGPPPIRRYAKGNRQQTPSTFQVLDWYFE